jgi:serine phosphatase RsbU (regulator of sigma subunit)
MANDSISGLFERLNQFLLERTSGEKHATVFYSVCHRNGRLIYANAGHCPPVLIRASGELVELDATSVPIGLIPGTAFPIAEQQLNAGDKMVAFSDGFSDIVDRAPMMRMLGDGADLSAANLHLALTAALGDGGFADDVTVLVAERLAGDDPAVSSRETPHA